MVGTKKINKVPVYEYVFLCKQGTFFLFLFFIRVQFYKLCQVKKQDTGQVFILKKIELRIKMTLIWSTCLQLEKPLFKLSFNSKKLLIQICARSCLISCLNVSENISVLQINLVNFATKKVF